VHVHACVNFSTNIARLYINSECQPIPQKPALEDIIRQHRSEVLRMDDDHETLFCVTVRRDQLLKDALDKVCGSSLVEQHELRVTFCGEPGVDDGGLYSCDGLSV